MTSTQLAARPGTALAVVEKKGASMALHDPLWTWSALFRRVIWIGAPGGIGWDEI
ncbi:hypothetical protein [Candidatus Palauibacter sp.]|uniref:hypothetical protein n=1 Tax=Candidatus Palauibacter sp. TaxID=3101350 RepID=UPI003B5A482B